MIFPLIISLVSIAISAFFPFIKYLNHKEYNKYKDAINYQIKMYSNYKDAIEFYLKNSYHFDIKYYTRDRYSKYYDLYIGIYKTAGTKRNIDDIFGVKELMLYDVSDYTLLSFIDAYGDGFTMYDANSVAFFDPPLDDTKRVLMQFDLYMKDSAEIMFMLMLIDYCNGKLDYYKKLIKGYEYYTFDMFLCGRYAIYSNKYTI